MYKIEQNQGVFIITVSGFIKEDEAQNFITDYDSYVKKIDPLKTNLILDGSKLATSAKNMIPILEGCLNMYIKYRFKQIFLTKFESAITMMQINNINSTQFLNKIIMVDNVDDALLKIKAAS